MSQSGAKFFSIPSAFTETTGKKHWHILLKARAIENQCYTIGVNRIGEDGNGFHFNGNSTVFDAFGKEVLSSTENKEEVLQIEISLDDLKLKRRQLNFLQDRDNFKLL